MVAVRPEAMTLGEGPESEFNNLRAVLSDVVYLGSKTQFLLQGGSAGDSIQVEMSRPPHGGCARHRRRDPLADRRHHGVSGAMSIARTHEHDDACGPRGSHAHRAARWSLDPRALLALPALAYIVLMFVLPLGLLLAKSLWGAGRLHARRAIAACSAIPITCR